MEAREPMLLSKGFRTLVLAPVALVSAFVLIGLLPWERSCDEITNLCYHAPIWGGTASLFGLLAEIFGAAFVVLSVARTRGLRPLSRAQVALLSAMIASGGVKLGMMFNDSAILLDHFNVSSPVYVGAWLGLTSLLLLGLSALAQQATLARIPQVDRPSWRRFIWIPVAFALVAGAAVPYALSGFGWWGGPLAPPDSFGAHLGLRVRAKPNEHLPIQATIYARNGGWTGATLDQVTLTSADPGIRLLGSYVVVRGPCPRNGVRLPLPYECGVPLAGSRVATGVAHEVEVLPVLAASHPGKYKVRGFELEYHIGMVRFRAPEPADISICVAGPGVRCP